jgi:hypothetical protein
MKKLNDKQVEGDEMLIEARTIEMHQNESQAAGDCLILSEC